MQPSDLRSSFPGPARESRGEGKAGGGPLAFQNSGMRCADISFHDRSDTRPNRIAREVTRAPRTGGAPSASSSAPARTAGPASRRGTGSG